MNIDKMVDAYRQLLSDVATEVSQACSIRSSVMEIYMGPNLPSELLVLFLPILLENHALFCFCLKDDELRERILVDSEELITELHMDPKTFFQNRFQDYASAGDASRLYSDFCAFIIQNKRNAVKSDALQDDYLGTLEGKTLIAFQLGAQKLQEAAESV